MRIKIFSARNIQDALDQVRKTLGENAIILDSQEEGDRVKITAAVEAPPPRVNPRVSPPPKPTPSPIRKSLKELEEEQQSGELDLEYYLSHHGLSTSLKLRLLDFAASVERENSLMALACALDSLFHFDPLNNDYQDRPVMLVGPPGVGKTVTAAKLASQAVLDNRPVRLVSTDTLRTGGLAQLEGYGLALKLAVAEAASPELLADLLGSKKKPGELTIVDTAGYNPYSDTEIAELHRFITAADVEPVLVLTAGTDPVEAREIAETYAALGVRRFIGTRLDAARRYASLLMAADGAGLTFAGVGITPYLADGIQKLDAVQLAKLLTKIPKRQNIQNLSAASPATDSSPAPSDETPDENLQGAPEDISEENRPEESKHS
ncbi:ATP-binding protein [Luteithermobacter gelatinilyticus]|uniref:flagellar biosynthesis protein FlhF n=1 Tax=Luteithermobacter gelatinilyticus TaxID=2582913 RepID=UPI0011073C26|nr:ATP-binding protein [Luteithermobacter gelatinilyticus]